MILAMRAALAEVQQARPLAVADVLDIRSFGEISPVVLSPDGKWIAYSVLDNRRTKSESSDAFTRTGVISRSEGDVWISNTESGQARNLTEARGANWQPSWSPNGRYLAFLSNRDGSGQAKVWVWDAIQDELRSVSNLPIRASRRDEIAWMPDSSKLLVATVPQGLSVEEYVRSVLGPNETQKREKQAADGATVAVYEGKPITPGSSFAPPPFNLDEYSLHDLVLIDTASGQTEFVTRGKRIDRYLLSPDGSHVVYAVPERFYTAGSWQRVYSLFNVDLETKKEELVASDVLLNGSLSWSPNSAYISYVTYGDDHASYNVCVAAAGHLHAQKIRVLPDTVSQHGWLSPMWDPDGKYLYLILAGALWKTPALEEGSWRVYRIPNRTAEYVISQQAGEVWTSDGGVCLIVVAHDDQEKRDGFYKIDMLGGKSTKLMEGGQCYTCVWPITPKSSYLTVVSRDGRRIAYIAEDAQHPADLWISNPDFQSARQLTHLNPNLEKYSMGSPKLIDWRSDDGERLRGALLLPPGYKPGKRYPLIVWVYPGASQSDDFDQFGFGMDLGPFNMQLFATRGYAVLFPDAKDNVGDRVSGLMKSVLSGVEKVVEIGIADSQRVAVMGHSQGGFATLALLVMTNRFKAAIAASGWGNSIAYYGAMGEQGTGYEYSQAEWQLGGAPWQVPLTYVQNSPVFYLDKVSTPVLLVHGSGDAEIPSFLTDEIFVGLHRIGKRVEYAKYLGEPHVPIDWSYANQTDLANRLLFWLSTYLN